MTNVDIPEALRARMNRPRPPAIDEVREFLLCHVADVEDLEELRVDIARTARLNKNTVLRDADAIETLLASPQPPGTLSWMVAAHGNWVLDDEASDAEAAEWLRGLATLIRDVVRGLDENPV
ncbi:hypothetical protein [Nocardia rhizosphaerae]|uniref:Uncharacterized protein n=1 Tax=Nocardia rhizosphaerae TaxID=1691571 RepID=A0ABV8LD80_9NOCA